MKALLFLLPAATIAVGHAQGTSVSLALPYGATLTMRRVPFRPAGHRVATQNSLVPATSAGRPLFGTDGELPRYQLASASLLLKGTRYVLPVGGMYNPWFGPKPVPQLFRLIRQPHGYLLWAMFSDGAGGYTARWQLAGSRAKRVLLSTDEQYCF